MDLTLFRFFWLNTFDFKILNELFHDLKSIEACGSRLGVYILRAYNMYSV